MRTIAVLASAALCACALAGCSDEDPVTPKPPVFKELTDKENVIYNLVKSYEKADIAHYEELLHEDFIWYPQEEDVYKGLPSFFDRATDTAITTRMFEARTGQQPPAGYPAIHDLSLTIHAAIWAVMDSVNGEPCTDCWITERAYELAVQTGNLYYVASDRLAVIVAAVPVGGATHYKMIAAYDVYDPGRAALAPQDLEEASMPSWSGIKWLYH